jgi:hypothetical protein
MKIENGRLNLYLDEQTGSIVRIVDTATQVIHTDAIREGMNDARLFRLLTPVERWSSCHADSHTSPAPHIEQSGATIVLRYPHLLAAGHETGITADIVIDLPPGRSEVLLTLRVHNGGETDITDILFPWLAGWSGLGGRGLDAIVLGGATSRDPHAFPNPRAGKTYSRYHQRDFYHYPVQLYCPWADISGPAGGLSLIDYTRVPRNVGFMLENLAGYGPGLRLSFGWTHFTQLRPGQSWQSPPIGLSVHTGDWRDTADAYTRWVETWYQPARTPDWARRAIGFQNVIFRAFDGTPFRDLGEIPVIARGGRAHGVEHLCVWDYYPLGSYGKLDDYDVLDYSPAEKEVLRQTLRQAREEGSRVSALVNWRTTNPTSSLYKNESHAEVCCRYDGTPQVELYCASEGHPMYLTRHLGPVCSPLDARIETYRGRVLRQLREYLDLGFTSLFYDQPFQHVPSYHPARGDDGPDGVHAATVSLAAEVRAVLRSMSPEGIMVGEMGDVFAQQSIDAWMAWYPDMADAERVAYTLPQTLHSWVVDNNVAEATKAFALGLQLCLTTFGCEGTLDDVPQFAEHVSRLARLRAACASRIAWGRFRHTRGIDVTSDGGIVAYAYESGDGPAIIIAAPGEGGTARVALDRAAFRAPGSDGGRLWSSTGDVQTVGATDTLTVHLDAHGAAVWMA